jgi:acyl transferase domain-containing protein
MAANLRNMSPCLKASNNCLSPVPPSRIKNSSISTQSSNQTVNIPQRYGKFLGEVGQFDPHLFDMPAEQKARLSPEGKLILESVWELFEDAGYSISRLNQIQTQYNKGIGVYLGVMYNQHMYRMNSLEEASIHSNSSEWQLANRISHFYNLTGPSMAVNTACSRSLTVVHLAC